MIHKVLAFALCSLPLFNCACADVITNEMFSLGTDGGTAVGNTLSVSRSFGAGDGVSFTATVNVTGSGNFDQGATVLGVAGDGSDLFNGTEWAQFAMTITNVMGGSVVFDGFSQIDLDSFTNAELAAISTDSVFDNPGDQILTAETGPDEFALANLSSFFLVADGDVDNNFRARDVTANFTTTAAVPEPSTFAVTGLLLAGLAWGRKNRNASATR